jgi:hypothetical protein
MTTYLISRDHFSKHGLCLCCRQNRHCFSSDTETVQRASKIGRWSIVNDVCPVIHNVHLSTCDLFHHPVTPQNIQPSQQPILSRFIPACAGKLHKSGVELNGT